MVAAMCEEVQNPEREVPKAIVLSVVAAGITGILYLVPLLFVLPDIQMLLSVANSQPIGLLFKTVTGSAAGGFGLLFLILGILMFAGIGALTAASRCTYAFARDGAIPGSKWWMKVNRNLDVPLNAMMLCAVVEVLLGLIYFGSSTAFNAFSGVGVICLTASYATPIAISLATGRKQVQGAAFYLGRWGYLLNVVAIGMSPPPPPFAPTLLFPRAACGACILTSANLSAAWSLLALPLFCMPSALPVTATTVNYAPAVFVAATGISALWYWVWGHKNYAGPPVAGEHQHTM